MIEITVKMQIEELSAETKGFLASLFAPYGGCVPCTCGIQTEEEQAKGPGPKPEVKAEDTKPTVDPNLAPEVRAEDPKPAAAAKKSYKTEDVRAAMASKLTDHRVELVNKLKDMGAKNVSSLPEDKYEEFINFCNSL